MSGLVNIQRSEFIKYEYRVINSVTSALQDGESEIDRLLTCRGSELGGVIGDTHGQFGKCQVYFVDLTGWGQ